MTFLRDVPVSRKITWVILLLTTLVLLMAGGALFGYQLYTFRTQFPREVASLGEIMASQSAGPLALKDPEGAHSLLRALQAKTYIHEAQIRLPEGRLFASYGPTSDWMPAVRSGVHLEGDHLVYAAPVLLHGEHLGTLFLRAAYREEMVHLARVYLVVLSVVLALAIVLAALLSTQLQKLISKPLLQLAAAAQAVATQRDYSVRVPKTANDEIGVFTDAFNQMLQQIQFRDEDLRRSRRKFQALVNSIEGVVWEADPETFQFLFVSRQAERLLGYPVEEWTRRRSFWLDHMVPEDRERVLAASRQAVADRNECCTEYRLATVDGSLLWVRSHFHTVVEDGRLALVRGVLFDITRERKAAADLAAMHQELLQTSRQAGMAEVATGVLHNVGNVLNSVNVSSTLVCERLRQSEIKTVSLLAGLLQEHEADMDTFLSADPKGRAIPVFIRQLATELERERDDLLRELERIARNVEHIKEIVGMQQSYARVSGVTETLSPVALVEDALQLNAVSLERHGVHVIREFGPVPEITVDRHKVLQILINLLRNARQALDEGRPERKQVTVAVARNGHDTVHICVADNGMGITAENLTRIFSLGFTTRRDGHGFGLHSGALAAREMGGSLHARSDGPGKGATFVLELPISC